MFWLGLKLNYSHFLQGPTGDPGYNGLKGDDGDSKPGFKGELTLNI